MKPGQPKPRLGLSACLAGQPVRFNGGHQRFAWLTDELVKHMDLRPVCPEIAMGLPVPRDTLRFAQEIKSAPARMIIGRNGTDVTELAIATAEKLVPSPAPGAHWPPPWDGFVFKKDSPSCGLERVKVYSKHGMPERSGIGIFAGRVKAVFPDLPVIEEGRLTDIEQREQFVSRVYAHARLRAALPPGMRSAAALQEFHRDHKLLLMSHSPSRTTELGRVVSSMNRVNTAESLIAYRSAFMKTLAIPATPGTRANALEHAFGHLKKLLDSAEKQRVLESIHAYRTGHQPFESPRTLLYFLIRKFRIGYLDGQHFFSPYPAELKILGRAK